MLSGKRVRKFCRGEKDKIIKDQDLGDINSDEFLMERWAEHFKRQG